MYSWEKAGDEGPEAAGQPAKHGLRINRLGWSKLQSPPHTIAPLRPMYSWGEGLGMRAGAPVNSASMAYE